MDERIVVADSPRGHSSFFLFLLESLHLTFRFAQVASATVTVTVTVTEM